jgi:hypothetical protein
MLQNGPLGANLLTSPKLEWPRIPIAHLNRTKNRFKELGLLTINFYYGSFVWMRYFNSFRYLILLVGIVGAFSMTALPTLNFTLINPAPSGIGNISEIFYEFCASLLGLFLLVSPFIFYFIKYRGISSPIVFIVGLLLSGVAIFAHFSISGGNSTSGIAYLTFFLPIQFVIVGLGLELLKKLAKK